MLISLGARAGAQVSSPPPAAQPDYNTVAANIKSGRECLSRHEYAPAESFFDSYIQVFADDPRGYFWKAVAEEEGGDDKEAVKIFLLTLDKAKTLSMDCAELRHNLGALLLKQGYVKQATYDFQRAIEIDPSLDAARIGLAQAHLLAGNNAAALAELQSLSEKGVIEPTMPFLKAKALLGLQRKDEAKAQLALYERGVAGATGELMDSARSMLQGLSQTDNKPR